MTRPSEFDPPPACRPTAARVQSVLDGRVPADTLSADPHLAACATCRERVAAARLLVAALAEPADPPAVPAGLTDAILAGVRADRRARRRRRVFAMAGGLAAAVLVAAWVTSASREPEKPDVVERTPALPPAPPAPRPSSPTPAPPPHPLRITDELARAGESLRDSSRTLTESASSAPKVFAALTDTLLKPAAAPVAADLEPARDSLAGLPDAARTGLEPVTGSAQKAFDRLLRDVGAIQPGRPKS